MRPVPEFAVRRVLRGSRLAVAVAALALAPLAARAETLTDALRAAYLNSQLLDQNRALLRAADEDVAQAIATLRPVLAWAASAGRTYNSLLGNNTTASLQLTASITIYDFGRTPLAIKAAKESVLAAREALLTVEQNVLLTAVQAYMEVIRAARFVDLRRSNVRVLTQELRGARERFAVGETTRTDVSIAESRVAAARAALAAAEGDYNLAREAYNAAIGHYPKNLVRPATPPMTARTVEEARAIAVKTHPLIRQRQREVTIAELNIARAQANKRPTLGASASAGVNQDEVRTGTVTLNLRQTIYSGGALASAMRQAIALAEAERAELLQSVILVKQDVAGAWSALRVAIASTEATQRQVAAAQSAYNGTREEAALGSRTTLDVLNAEQELLDARASLIQAQIQQFVAVYTLLATMGLLTADHLELGLVTYDPLAYYNAVDSAPVFVSPQGEKLDNLLKTLGK